MLENIEPLYGRHFVPDGRNAEYIAELRNLPWVRKGDHWEYSMHVDENAVLIKSKFVEIVMAVANKVLGVTYNHCDIKRLSNHKEYLGWRSFDTESSQPVSIVSVGCERDLFWKPKDVEDTRKGKVALQPNSLFTMPPGFQDRYLIKMPKHHSPTAESFHIIIRSSNA